VAPPRKEMSIISSTMVLRLPVRPGRTRNTLTCSTRKNRRILGANSENQVVVAGHKMSWTEKVESYIDEFLNSEAVNNFKNGLRQELSDASQSQGYPDVTDGTADKNSLSYLFGVGTAKAFVNQATSGGKMPVFTRNPKVQSTAPRNSIGAPNARLSELQSQGHALERHGGSVSDEQLMNRAYTGIAPDGSALSGGRTPDSTAFHNDNLLVQADDFLRQGALKDAIANAAPGQIRLTVSGDMGVDVGRGYLPGGKVSGLDGPLLRVDNITNVQATYVYNATSGNWETLTIFPKAR
jgi:hypothetical protein